MQAALQIFFIMMAVMAPVILVVFISEYFKNKRTTNAQLGELKKELHENSTDDLEKQIAELKERIVVLESIVTDRSYDLERKIGSL
jgi:SOS-response transcriptional repressor LexA